MYPRNAASPERIGIGPVVQISDGAVQTSGVSISVRGQGGASGAGSGTTAYDNGIVEYTPTQAETDFTSFVVVAYKTGCIPVSQTIITSASATAGYAGVDWSKITAPTTTLNLSGTTVKTATDVEADTQDIQARLPAALVSGRIDASVGAMAANVMTAAAAAADLTTELQSGLATAAALTTVEGKIDTIDTVVDAILDDTGTSGVVVAAGSKTGYTLTATTGLGNQTANITGSLSGSVGSVTGAVGSVTGNVGGNVTGNVGSVVGAVGSVTGNVGGNVTGSVGSVATGGITAASLAADAITAAKVAADVTTEMQSGLATASAVSTLQTSVNDLPTADQNADALLKRDWTAVTGEAARSVLNALRFLRNKWSISGGTLTVTEEDDTTTAWTGTVTTAAGNPTTQIDPS